MSDNIEKLYETNDIRYELGTNFIEYAVACNTDRAIPNAADGLKPVAKRILYCAFDQGFGSSKTHVKCANIVGNVMADFHPHGDSSIYGALVRLSQPWVMRYPLIDFHGSNGNIDGDGPAAYRYTEAKLAKLTEDGMLTGIKKNNVDFISNYQETKEEPVELPSIFPNLLCNPNSGIGVAMACSWAPHNLKEVAQAIYDYMDGKNPTLPGPDFPTGGIVINKNDIPNIMATGHGSVKVRGKYVIENQNIVFTELPYGVNTEALMTEIGEACENGEVVGIEEIRNESNKKGFRLVLECNKTASIPSVVNKLFAKTSLQTSFSYNQIALIDKTPTELNLKDCIKIYVDKNSKCIVRECLFDINKAQNRLHILNGLIKALENIDEIIALIKSSTSAAVAKENLISSYGFTENQATAILDMKLSRLAKLEKLELEKEKSELEALLIKLKEICENPIPELRSRLEEIVKKYGDERRTELTQITVDKEEKEIQYVEPEKCVVIMTEGGSIKRVSSSSFRAQKRNGKGVKTQEDITSAVIRTNTIDSLMIFTNFGKMYRLLVDKIPVGTNATKGTPVKNLIEMESGEEPEVIYSIYRDTDAKYVLFATKDGLVKKTDLQEYIKTKKKNGISAISIKEGDSLRSVTLVKDEEVIIVTKMGHCIRFNSNDISVTSRTSSGVKGIDLVKDDEVVAMIPIHDSSDDLAIFTTTGFGKRIKLSDVGAQKRGGKGYLCNKIDTSGETAGAALINDKDNVLIVGKPGAICIEGSEIPILNRLAIGNKVISGKIASVSKI